MLFTKKHLGYRDRQGRELNKDMHEANFGIATCHIGIDSFIYVVHISPQASLVLIDVEADFAFPCKSAMERVIVHDSSFMVVRGLSNHGSCGD